MYESFYGLKEKPFTLLPDPEYLYLSQKHQRALTLLEYGMMNHAGFSVICGDTGAGKTTLIRSLLTELGEDTTVGMITNTHESFGELLNWVLMAFGIDSENKSKSQMHQMLIEFLIEQYALNKRTVLIVDEAQNMKAETLEELRMLSNINADKDQVLQVILAGQPLLRDTLRKPELMQFAQRIAVDYYLESLNQAETHSYIQHRLEVAGANYEIFTPDACDAVYKYSGGTPRLINLLCDTSMVYGFAEQTRQITAELVEDVVREQHSNSIVPTFNMSYQQQAKQQKTSIEQNSHHSAQAEQQNTSATNINQQPRQVANQSKPQAEKTTVEVPTEQSHTKTSSVAVETPRHNITEAEEIEKEPIRDTKVTPIKQDVNFEQQENLSQNKQTKKETEAGKSSQKNSVKDNNPEDTDSEFDFESFESDTSYHSSSYNNSHQKHRKEHYDDIYPIVQVESSPKQNTNLLILGIASGMFIASISMVVAGYWLFTKNPDMLQQESKVQNPPVITEPQSVSNQRAEEIERAKLAALEKERDAALAMTRALERERDAALASAKAQEDMRAAEQRAAEIMAEQERKVALQIKRATQQALQAEIAAAQAKERERIAKEEARKARLEAERERMAKIEAQTVTVKEQTPVITNTPEKETAELMKALEQKQEVSTNQTTQESPVNGLDDTKFSANPCNSASAKFLSTCKK